MVRTQVYLDKGQASELKILANASGKNFSELIREGVDLAISKNKPKRKKKFGEGFIGAAKRGEKTDAVKIIREYYENFGE